MKATQRQRRRGLMRALDAAAKRVETRGDRPPREHLSRVDLTLYCFNDVSIDDLSARKARWVRNHLASCRACLSRKERMAREFRKPASTRMVRKTLRLLDRMQAADEAAKAHS
ncbi:MAG: hypothetical protein Q8R16_00085 [bacterium]|nr:hypothetical protein [bacterium]